MIPKLLNKNMKRSSSTNNYIKKSPISPIKMLPNPKIQSEIIKRSLESLFKVSGKSPAKNKNKNAKPYSYKQIKETKSSNSKNPEPAFFISQIFGSSKDLRPPHKSPSPIMEPTHKSPLPSINPTSQYQIFDTLPLSFNPTTSSKLTFNVFKTLREKNSFRARRLRTPF